MKNAIAPNATASIFEQLMPMRKTSAHARGETEHAYYIR
jgi:hypothetical protein